MLVSDGVLMREVLDIFAKNLSDQAHLCYTIFWVQVTFPCSLMQHFVAQNRGDLGTKVCHGDCMEVLYRCIAY